MRVGVVGAGYVGLVTGACLAELGHQVTVADVDSARIEAVSTGRSPIHEVGLSELLQRNLGNRLGATTDVAAAAAADVVLIAVGTPLQAGEMDPTALLAAVSEVGKAWRGRTDYPVLVVKSTVVPGTTDGLVAPALEAAAAGRAGVDFGVGVNPEFLTEGQALADFMSPDRIVIGANEAVTLEVLEALYRVFPSVPLVRTNARTAEMVKYASNALLATMISFSNEIANLGAAVGGIDVVEVMAGVHSSRYLSWSDQGELRVAPIASYLMAGCGYGGSCLPKDVQALAALARSAGEEPRLLDAVTAINTAQPGRLVEMLAEELPSLRGAKVTVLGLSFKPDTGDTRESPALAIIRSLLDAGSQVVAHDPVVTDAGLPGWVTAGVEVTSDLAQAVEQADAIVLVTAWDQYRGLAKVIGDRQPLVVDGRRFLDRHAFARYRGVGL